ncbi:putative Ig domain-containing protein (plasmid) [Peteryoungia desertarenae]|uniref:Ig domain-containing protein n=1 Tax=Peteryoungia desertarenae TaxID=1813451 RepID=A0ABX6QUT2_9HYPH|nr:Ig domain-containing protein [Peteryoungia desertarenae]QLF72062.1 putative Ig domain-containing protein [Peteryoungia desertarenae]
MRSVFALVLLLALPMAVQAACTDPAEPAGAVIYNTNTNTLQYCNGTGWVNTGAVMPAAPQTGCTNPTGQAGQVIYAASLGVVQFCNGSSWVDTACAAKRKPGGSGCGGQPAGTMQYNTTHNELQFCDSTDWVAMGWPCPSDLSTPVWNAPTSFTYNVMEGDTFGIVPTVTDDSIQPLTYSQSGTLPPGLSLNSGTGAVSGNPTTVGSYTFTLRATDSSGNYVEREFTVNVTPAEVVAVIAASANNVNIQSLFSAPDWADSARTKRVVINSGVTIGSTNPAIAALLTGTGRGGDLEIIIGGEVQGAGGVPNGGAGGPAINVQQTGAVITNNGAIRGGGGGGGRGGSGTATVLTNREPASGFLFQNDFFNPGPTWQWQDMFDGTAGLYWGQTYNPFAYVPMTVTSADIGGYRYYRGPDVTGGNGYLFSIAREQIVSGPTTGGDGGRGQGSDGAAASGLAGGTNAGTGGAGGSWGQAGAAGSAGNATGGATGGAAGAAIMGVSHTLVNTGTVLGTY